MGTSASSPPIALPFPLPIWWSREALDGDLNLVGPLPSKLELVFVVIWPLLSALSSSSLLVFQLGVEFVLLPLLNGRLSGMTL